MYSDSNDMLEALIRYGVSGMGISSFWSILAVDDGLQWVSDAFHIEETK